MTRTTPRRRMILQFSQRRFTDGLTFIVSTPSPVLYETSSQPNSDAYKMSALALPRYNRVKISGSPSVTAIVCSK